MNKVHGVWSTILGGFTALCFVNFPMALAFLTGIGLGFLINDLILFPIFFFSLGVMVYSLNYNRKNHLSFTPIFVAIISALIILTGVFFETIVAVVALGVAGLFIATIWDFILIINMRRKEEVID